MIEKNVKDLVVARFGVGVDDEPDEPAIALGFTQSSLLPGFPALVEGLFFEKAEIGADQGIGGMSLVVGLPGVDRDDAVVAFGLVGATTD